MKKLFFNFMISITCMIHIIDVRCSVVSPNKVDLAVKKVIAHSEIKELIYDTEKLPTQTLLTKLRDAQSNLTWATEHYSDILVHNNQNPIEVEKRKKAQIFFYTVQVKSAECILTMRRAQQEREHQIFILRQQRKEFYEIVEQLDQYIPGTQGKLTQNPISINRSKNFLLKITAQQLQIKAQYHHYNGTKQLHEKTTKSYNKTRKA